MMEEFEDNKPKNKWWANQHSTIKSEIVTLIIGLILGIMLGVSSCELYHLVVR